MNCKSMGALLAAITLCACSSVNLWPFGEKKPEQAPSIPANSVAYQCSGGKKFYVRMLDGGNAAWLILPEREVSLAKTAATRYSNGVTTLTVNGAEAMLELSAGNLYSECKSPASK